MGFVPDWISTVPLLVALLLIIYVPGALVLEIAGTRRSLVFGFAPALTCGLVGIVTAGLGAVGIPWGWPAFVSATVLAAGLAIVYRGLVRRRGRGEVPIGGAVEGSSNPARYRGFVFVAAALAVLIHWIPLIVLGDLRFPSGLSDPMFHYNGINAVLNTGNASMFGAMDWNYGLRVLSVTYPSIWHALAALVASPGAVLAPAHVLSYLVTPVIFISGMASLGAEVFPRTRMMAAVTPLVAAGFVAFPDFMVVGKAFWPNALAMAIFPGVLAISLAVILDVARGGLRRNGLRYLGGMLVLLGGLAGLVMAHPTFAFTLLWVGAPVGILLLIRLVRRFRGCWPRTRLLLVSGSSALALGAVLWVVFSNPQVQAALSRPVIGDWQQVPERLMSTLMLWPASRNPVIMLGISIFYGVSALAGAILASRSRRSRWVLAAWGMQTLLMLGVYFPIPGVAQIAGIWYSDIYRLFAIQVVFLSILVSMALVTLWTPVHAGSRSGGDDGGASALRDRWAGSALARAVVVVFLALHLTLGVYLAQNTVYGAVVPAVGDGEVIGSQEELALLDDLEEHVPDGALVLGDPLSGIGYAPALSDVDSVFTQSSMRALDVDGNYLAENFAEIHKDPRVCEIIDHYGITHFYEDAPVRYEGTSRLEQVPGFYGVDTSHGFTLVVTAGTASLWTIDACEGEARHADWWDESWRGTPLRIEDPSEEPGTEG